MARSTEEINYHFQLAIAYVKSGEYTLAFNHMLIAAESKITAQYNIGVFYEYGMGVSRSFSKASKWYTLAASQGHEQAIESLKDLIQNRSSRAYCFFSGIDYDTTIIDYSPSWLNLHPHSD